MTRSRPLLAAHRASPSHGTPAFGLPDLAIVAGLGAAIGYAALRQGGFYRSQLTIVVALVAVAAIGRALRPRRPVSPAIAVAAAALVLFAGWAALRAESWQAAAPPAAMALLAAAGLVCASGLPDRHRQALLAVVLAVAAVVAASCWIGLAFHVSPLALTSSGLWRAASTLTYANATAAFLVIAVLVAITALPDGGVRTAVVAVLALGLVATMSRAGAVGLVVAAAVLLLSRRRGTAVRSLTPVLPAVTVAGAALLPSLPVGASPHPWLAGAGLIAGALVLVGGRRMRPRHLLAGLVAGAAVASVLVALVPAARTAAAGIVDTRLTLESAERADLARVTAAQFRTAPWTGIGPGELDLRYVDHTGARVRAVFTHDEYLQTAAETGLVGLGLVVVALVAVGLAGLRARTVAGTVATAAVAGFAAHSAFDFLWHIPVLPLLLAVATALLLTGEPQRPAEPSTSTPLRSDGEQHITTPLRSDGESHTTGAQRSNGEDVL